MKYFVLFLFVFLLFLKCPNEDNELKFKYITLKKQSIENISNETSIPDSFFESSYSILESLPLNYDTTGIIDYTVIIQNVLDNHAEVTFPDFPLLINQNGLTIRSNNKIFFKKGSKLVLQANSKERYEVLRLHEVHNVELYSPHILGDRETHMGNTGEWGFGISIRGSQKINIYQAEVKNCWGDGIYLGSIGDSLVNTDIKIEDCLIDNNRRNGISIISGINIDIVNCFVSNTNGTAPEGGIDIEPNNNQEFLDNINIINATTFNNGGTGLSMVFTHFKGPQYKEVKINVKNHVDDLSLYGMGFAFGDMSHDYGKIEGNIDVINSVWKNNKRGLIAIPDFSNNLISLNFITPIALHKDSDITRKRMEELIGICEEEETFSIIE